MNEELFIDHSKTSIDETEEQQQQDQEWYPLDMSQFHNENLSRFLIYQAI